MPRLSKEIPKYCHKKQGNLAFVKLDGRQRFLGTYDTPQSREQYDRLIALWMSNGRSLPVDWERATSVPSPSSPTSAQLSAAFVDLVPEETTIGEVIAAYLPYAKTFYKANRTYEQVAQLFRFLRAHHERTPVVSFGPEQLFSVRNYWVINGWGRKHTNDMAKRLVAIFRWAAEKSASPSSGLRVPIQVWETLKTVRGLPKGRPLFTFDGVVSNSKPGNPMAKSGFGSRLSGSGFKCLATSERQKLTSNRLPLLRKTVPISRYRKQSFCLPWKVHSPLLPDAPPGYLFHRAAILLP